MAAWSNSGEYNRCRAARVACGLLHDEPVTIPGPIAVQFQRSGRFCSLVFALTLAGLPSAAHASVETYQAQLACETPQTKLLLQTPLRPDPHDNVWALEVLEAMGVHRVCNELDLNLFARYLERTALNAILKEPIPSLATVREAIAWEKKVEAAHDSDRYEGVTSSPDKLRDRALTKSFAPALWNANASELEMLKTRPHLDRSGPGVWRPQQEQASAMGPVIALTFTNVAGQPVPWETRMLIVQHAADSPFDRYFNCFVDGVEDDRRGSSAHRSIPPGERINVGCAPASTGWDVREVDAAWIERITGEGQWILQGPPPGDTIYTYRETISKFASAASRQTAEQVIRSLSCEEKLGCIGPKLEMMNSTAYRLGVIALPSALVGVVLLAIFGLGRPQRMCRIAPRLIGVIIALTIAAVAALVIEQKEFGLGGIALLFMLFAAAGGSIVGIVTLAGFAGALNRRARG